MSSPESFAAATDAAQRLRDWLPRTAAAVVALDRAVEALERSATRSARALERSRGDEAALADRLERMQAAHGALRAAAEESLGRLTRAMLKLRTMGVRLPDEGSL